MILRVNVGILGATGMVGQNYIRLLENHPWFSITYLAASPQSAGKRYAAAIADRWLMPSAVPETVKNLVVGDANDVSLAKGKCDLLFSAVDLDKKAVEALEIAYASAGFAVVSNHSAHRLTPDVPMVIPEINADHLDVIIDQRRARGWDSGCIAVKSNCSIQSYTTPVWAWIQAGYRPQRMIVTTLQAVSGAGYPGVASLDMLDNVVPFIKGEEEKSEIEPQKVLGHLENGVIVRNTSLQISAHCNRVPVVDGHIACVSVAFEGKKPDPEETIRIWRDFRSVPQQWDLPSAPKQPIIYREEPNRPQPRKDRDLENAMAVVVGRLRPCKVLDLRFVGLHHNTIRGAAGGAILTAELMRARGLIG